MFEIISDSPFQSKRMSVMGGQIRLIVRSTKIGEKRSVPRPQSDDRQKRQKKQH